MSCDRGATGSRPKATSTGTLNARGVVFVAMGALLARAGWDKRPSEAGGMAEALGSLLTQPFGATLLAVTSAGVICFGVWQLLHARYARV